MALKIDVLVRNTRLNAIKTAIDAGGAAGVLNIYNSPQPATGGSASGNTLLAQLTFSFPSAAAAAAGVLTFSAITADASADATGTAAWCRVLTSAGVFVFDGVVATSGADYNLNTVSITLGVQVSCTSAAITEGNA